MLRSFYNWKNILFKFIFMKVIEKSVWKKFWSIYWKIFILPKILKKLWRAFHNWKNFPFKFICMEVGEENVQKKFRHLFQKNIQLYGNSMWLQTHRIMLLSIWNFRTGKLMRYHLLCEAQRFQRGLQVPTSHNSVIQQCPNF